MKLAITLALFLSSLASSGQQLTDREIIYRIMAHNIVYDDKSIARTQTAFRDFIASHPATICNLTQ